MTFTTTEKRKAIERELAYRRYVFPRRVEAGKMTQAQADRQIAILEEILTEYKDKEEREHPHLL